MNNIENEIKEVKEFLLSDSNRYYSEFWSDLLKERTNFPNAEQLTNFLSNDASYGYGNILDSNTLQTFQRLVDTITPETPIDFLTKLSDPIFGGPIVWEYKGVQCSIPFLHNLPTTYRIQTLPLKKNLRILEIGAGFGGVAYQLCQILDIKKYTIVDLPESLFLSYFYLRENTKKPCVLSAYENISNGFEFAKPDQLATIDNQFDLILNTISMGEMDMDMVETYKSLIRNKLDPGGYFFLINTHGKAGVKKPAQYLIDGMKLYSMRSWGQRAHERFFNKLHYEIIQTQNVGEEINDKVKNEVNSQGCLANLGARLPIDESVCLYEKGLRSYAQRKTRYATKYLREALDKGLTGFARTVAIVILLSNDWRIILGFKNEKLMEQAFQQAPIQKDEINRFFRTIFSRINTIGSIRSWLRRELL